MSAGVLQFDPESHSYRLDGVPIPGVTSILKDLSEREYRFVKAETMAEAAWLGQAVHKVIELESAGTLDEDALDARLREYLDAWRHFRTHSGFVPTLSEEKVYSRRYHYAGQLDLFGALNSDAALIDAKRCAGVPRTAGPQTAGYEIALRECRPDLLAAFGGSTARIRRYALHLTPNVRPGYRLVPFTDPNDARVFLSALTLNTWSTAA
jgi:hypothetical protein